MSPFRFSDVSYAELQTCHPDLQAVFHEVLGVVDVTILCGHRGEEAQNRAFEMGRSELQWPNGKHNAEPSNAVDAAPFPVRWDDRERFVFLAGVVKGISHARGIKIRWGGDWDSDNDLRDQTFMDLAHFELVEPRPVVREA